ncbi:MAG: RecQ family ATP-dependent DNA helicase [Luteolibacter sp.]
MMLTTLREIFGYESFRDGQEPVIQALLDGKPALAVFPTGGGKSLCYQLPAILLDGLSLVVSPLIALMRDQVDSLVAKGVKAARLDSTLDPQSVSEVFTHMENGTLKLLYVAPERFANEAFRQRLKRTKIAMIAIDEAHCISEWGHNFRPDYLKLARICRQLKVSRVLALTATATPKVAEGIRKHFQIARENHVQLSFHRPNLDLRITPCAANERKSLLLQRLLNSTGPAIVYVTRQETTEEIATFLAKEGLSARAYHAGLRDEVRGETQNSFMVGETRIIVATIAFGMGIDKSDIRCVIHYNLPKSLENYVQEIGRAGRDGQTANCEMLACGVDLTVLENFIHADAPSPRALGNLLDRILRLGARFDLSIYDLSHACDIRSTVIETVLIYLEIDGIIEVTGTFYANFRIRLLREIRQITAGMPHTERRTLENILHQAKGYRGSLTVDVVAAAATLGISRVKIAAILNNLAFSGDASVTPSGVRREYRLKKDVGSITDLQQQMVAAFERRQESDLKRLQQVLSLSSEPHCLTKALTRHFGEELTTPCGHCDRCRGLPSMEIRRENPRHPSQDDLISIQELIAEKHAALGTPRQLARFLCGMTSPASTRARLTRHDHFGLLSDLPFTDVLTTAEAMI